MAERVASRTTENGTTLVLKRRKSNRFNRSKYEYYVTEKGSNSRVGQYEGSQVDGMNQLKATKRQYESAESGKSRSTGGGPSLPGFGGGGGGGGPMLPGFGMGSTDEGEEEDDEFRFPWM